MMRYKTGEDRHQIVFGKCLDDYISEDNICRVIDAICNTLDIEKLGFKYAKTEEAGQSPYNPKDLTKLYLYGYINRISSSGKLAQEATRNIEIMWLMKNLKPSKRTICRFKEDNKECLKKVFREFNRIYRQIGLFGGKLVAQDSVKIKAQNSKKNNHNAKTIKKTLKNTEERIEQYMLLLDEADAKEGYSDEHNLTSEEIKNVISKLTAKKEKFEALQEKLEKSEESEISTTDEDSRIMKQGSGKGFDVSYNTQVVADSKNKMILDYETTNNSSDKGNLELVEEVKKELGVDEIILLADSGYYDGKEILKAEENQTRCIIPKPKAAKQAKEDAYRREKFTYDEDKDIYLCPCGVELKFMRTQLDSNGDEASIYANYKACAACPNKEKCTKSKKGREINRKKMQDKLDKIDRRPKLYRLLFKKRQEIIEHPFGTIKWGWGFNRYQTRGLEKVDAENALIFSAYNLRRAINILGTRELIEAINALSLPNTSILSTFFAYLLKISIFGKFNRNLTCNSPT